MCGGTRSFSATADTLKQLVEIVDLHLRQTKGASYESHSIYLNNHPQMKKHLPDPGKKYPDNAAEILSSPLFSWAIQKLEPFNKIFDLFKIERPILEPPLTATP
jgi:hypothetical protein